MKSLLSLLLGCILIIFCFVVLHRLLWNLNYKATVAIYSISHKSLAIDYCCSLKLIVAFSYFYLSKCKGCNFVNLMISVTISFFLLPLRLHQSILKEGRNPKWMFWLWRIFCSGGILHGFMIWKDLPDPAIIQIPVEVIKFYWIRTWLRQCQLLQYLSETRQSGCWKELFGMILPFLQ